MYRSQCTPQITTVVMRATFIKGPIMIGLIVQHLYSWKKINIISNLFKSHFLNIYGLYYNVYVYKNMFIYTLYLSY